MFSSFTFFRPILALWLLIGAVFPLTSVAAAPRDMPVSPNTAGSAPVAVIPVHQSIESGLYKFMQRAFREAEEAGAMYIVLDINTLGGRVDTAEEIGELVRGSQIPTVAFVHGKAVSAGSYIALNAGVIMMEPGSSIGSAAVVDGTGREVESAKVVSHWASEMRSAAELRQRDPRIAEAMVDKNVGVSLPGLNRTVQQGELVSLTAEEAYAVGYADRVAKNLQEVKHFLNADHHPELMISPSPAETLARFLVQPYIATLLLVIGIAGVAIELFVPGFGLPGILGLVGFGLYFFGHYIAGFAGGEELALFALGIVLLILELFVSSFGLLGVAGILCLFGSVVMAAYNTASAVISLGIAAAIALVIIIIVVRLFKHRGVWNKFILRDELRTEQGYVSTPSKMGLLGQPGTAITPLRPAGTALFQGQRVDVVTNGEFIPAQTDIYVVGVEGVRVVVARKV